MADDATVPSSFPDLNPATKKLNAVSDELGRVISRIDNELRDRGLGIMAWVKFFAWHDPQYLSYGSREIGYAKVSGKWGIALRVISGNENDPGDDSEERWLFNDAPRWLRVEGIDKLGALMEALIAEANSTAEKLKEKIGTAERVYAALMASRPSDEKPPQRRK